VLAVGDPRELSGPGTGSDLRRILTVWESKETLSRYRASVDAPGGVLMNQSVGAEPTPAVFEVAARGDHP